MQLSAQHPFGLLTIDLSAIQSNWRQLRACLAGGAECGAVVKADAYGLGMEAVGRALQQAGCRSFFVVNHEEGVALRRALGIEPVIYLLQGIAPGAEPLCCENNLVPVLVTYPMALRWLAFCESEQVPQAQRHAALKINTGMNRLGLEQSELQLLLEDAGSLAKMGCQLLISHLACADEPEHPLNNKQLAAFRQALTQVRQQIPHIRASLANSAATVQGEPWHFDLVRPGIGLYGSNPTGLPQHQMRPVVTLELPVIQSRQVEAGSCVGYGATYVAKDARRLISVMGGYGDGVFRSLGNVGQVWFNQLLPMVGRVSMDSFIVDVTALQASQQPLEGDLIELLGAHIGIDAAAQAAGTVAYEILTRLSGRYKRRYLLNGEPLQIERETL